MPVDEFDACVVHDDMTAAYCAQCLDEPQTRAEKAEARVAELEAAILRHIAAREGEIGERPDITIAALYRIVKPVTPPSVSGVATGKDVDSGRKLSSSPSAIRSSDPIPAREIAAMLRTLSERVVEDDDIRLGRAMAAQLDESAQRTDSPEAPDGKT